MHPDIVPCILKEDLITTQKNIGAQKTTNNLDSDQNSTKHSSPGVASVSTVSSLDTCISTVQEKMFMFTENRNDKQVAKMKPL